MPDVSYFLNIIDYVTEKANRQILPDAKFLLMLPLELPL